VASREHSQKAEEEDDGGIQQPMSLVLINNRLFRFTDFTIERPFADIGPHGVSPVDGEITIYPVEQDRLNYLVCPHFNRIRIGLAGLVCLLEGVMKMSHSVLRDGDDAISVELSFRANEMTQIDPESFTYDDTDL
jgi:hypothetical protein